MNQDGGPDEPVCRRLDIVFGGGDVQCVRPEWQSLVGDVVQRRGDIVEASRAKGEWIAESELPIHSTRWSTSTRPSLAC